MLKYNRFVNPCLTFGAAALLFTGAGTKAHAELFPTVTLINASDPMHPFNEAKLYIRRDLVAPKKWLWTYDLDNLKDSGSAANKIPIRRFFVGIDPTQAGYNWHSHITPKKSCHSKKEVPNAFVADGDANFIKSAVLDSDDLMWNWDNGSTTNTKDDFLGGTMRFQFYTDLPKVTFTSMEARGSKGPGAGIGASPAAVPEPASLALLLSGVAPLVWRRRRAAGG